MKKYIVALIAIMAIAIGGTVAPYAVCVSE